MNSITQTLRYLPHDLKTCFFACKTYLVNKDKTGNRIGPLKIFVGNIIFLKHLLCVG